MIEADNVIPLRGRVLIRAVKARRTESGLYLPTTNTNRYPTIGIVHRTSPLSKYDIPEGDLALISNEGQYVDRSYYDVFKVRLRDSIQSLIMTVDASVEPVFREQMEIFRANPATEDRQITLKDVETDEVVSFNCSDVEDFGYEQVAFPGGYYLEYIETYMIDLYWNGSSHLFYIIDERRILGTFPLRNEDLGNQDPAETEEGPDVR